MKTEELSPEDAIAADVAELRQRFPRTSDLYREVCVSLFFRHGITPTANKLYQLVRKGSMSAPTEALSNFWKVLRERSRVTVEHADLPDELRAAAGEMVAALWRSAQTRSLDALAELRKEAAEAVAAAEGAEAKARDANATTLEELEQSRAAAHTKDELIDQLRQELAAAAATSASMELRLIDLQRQLADIQLRADQQAAVHLAEREKLDERTRMAEQRFAEMEKRALVDMDRERTVAAKLQKTLESERNMHARSLEQLRAEQATFQESAGQLRGQLSAVQNAVKTLTQERDFAREEAQTIRLQRDNAIATSAAASAMAEQLKNEIDRMREKEGPTRTLKTRAFGVNEFTKSRRKTRLTLRRGGEQK